MSFLALGLTLAQFGVVLGSWLVSAAFPETQIRSLLSDEGIRWYFGKVVENMASPILVWLILLSSAWGAIEKSKLLQAFRHRIDFQERTAFNLVRIELGIAIIVMILLTCTPHAILLSATGNLYPSSFSASIVPVLAFVGWTVSSTYAFVSGKFHTFSEAFHSCVYGISKNADLIFLLLVLIQLIDSIKFVVQ